MSKTIADYTAANSIDASNDYLLIEPSGNTVYKKINRNVLLGLASAPLGTTDSQSPTNKTFNNTNTFTIKDGNLTLQSSGGVTKQAQFVLSGITAGQTRTVTLPDANITVVGTAATQTLTNKTLTSPTINSGSIDQSTITVDSIAGHTSASTGTIYGLAITSGVISGSSTVPTAAIQANAITTAKLASGASFLPSTVAQIPYKFSVYRNAALNATNGIATVVFDTKTFDTGTNFNTTTGLFTAPVTGFYFFSWSIPANAGTTSFWQASLYKASASTVLCYGSYGGSGTTGATTVGSALVSLTANDTIGIQLQAGGTNALFVAAGGAAQFHGYLVSAT